MRPRHLILEGLSCFKDPQEIDLDSLDLFAISGPTGAGKSTLLDAIIFALYGEVPRVTKENRSEMISASRDRAVVVLEFEVGKERYRIARTLRRTGGHNVLLEKHDGADFTVSLADQIRPAGEKVIEILGLDAAAFMQAVVLPQGEFAKFLKSQPRERRSMLRSLLRLDVYEKMREQAQLVMSTTKTAVESTRKVLSSEYAGVDPDALAELETRRDALCKALKQLRVHRDEGQQQLIVLRDQHSRSVELSKKQEESATLQRAAAEIDRARERLAAAKRAAPLVSPLEEARRADDTATVAAKQLVAAKEEDEQARVLAKAKAIALAAAEKEAEAIPGLRNSIAALQQVLGHLPEVQRLDSMIAQQTASIEGLAVEIARLDADVGSALTLQKEQNAAIVHAQCALNASGYDAELDALIESVRERGVVLGSTRSSAADAEKRLAAKQQDLDQLRRQLLPLQEDARRLDTQLEERRTALHDAEHARHEAQQRDAASALRSGLKPHAPCPVCEQTVISPPPATLAHAVEAARQRLAAESKLFRDAESKAHRAHEAVTRTTASVTAEEKTWMELTEQLTELNSKTDASVTELRAALARHAPPAHVVMEDWIKAAVSTIAARRRAHGEADKALRNAERAFDKVKDHEANIRQRLDTNQAALRRTEEERQLNHERRATLRGELAAVTQSDDPAAEAATLNKQVEAIEKVVKNASDEAAKTNTKMVSAQEVLRLKIEYAKRADEEAAVRATRLREEIARSSFADAAAVTAALLDEDTYAKLAERVRQHDQETHATKQRISLLQAELGDVRVSDEDLARAKQTAQELCEEVEKQHGEQKTLEGEAEQMKNRLARSNKMRTELASNEKNLQTYTQLANDLRSDKFQAYVLEETFTELVQGASTRLLRLTSGRYSLLFKGGEILVVDNDNAGETRISDTLSGGETFLTSLSLALELSDQVQRAAGAVNLDSLFIDEGFGTLDPDTLALVSETIQNLGSGGRMVGIITHIPELRDEFAQQIIVTKHQGYSTIEVRGSSDQVVHG